MNKVTLGFAVALLTGSAACFADGYQFELGGFYNKTSLSDDYSSYNIDVVDLTGVVHFSPLSSDREQPLAEIGFLEKSNNVRLSQSKWNSKDIENNYTLAIMDVYVPNAMLYVSPFYVYNNGKYDGERESDNTYGVNLGVTPIDGLRIATFWVDEVDYEINFNVKYVTDVGYGQAINIEFGYEKSEDSEFSDAEDYIGAAFDYYLDSTLSVGVTYDSIGGFANFLSSGFFVLAGEDAIGLRGKKYFSDAISAQVKLSKSDYIDNFMLGINWRF